MEIQDYNPQTFVDIFGKGSEDVIIEGADKTLNFGGNDNQDIDILSTKKEDDKGDDQSSEGSEDKDNKEVDILTPKKDDEITYTFKDTSGYFEDRFKSGKFVAITEDQEDGSKKAFIPKTPEEFDEVIDIQVNYKLDQERKELESKIYESKSPAWQAVMRYSEMTDDPADIIPFIQGIQNIESVSSLNPEEIDQAEKIVRTRLSQRGDDAETIEETVQSLKTTDKLITTAQKYKPAMVNEERNNLSSMVQQRQAEERQYISIVNSVRDNAIKAIESPIFGKHKLKKDEKEAIYDLIAEPSKETKGYPIYTVIDSLFEKGDFETLRQIALLLTKKDSFMTYINNAAADKAGEGIQRRLRIAGEGKGSGKDSYGEDIATVSRKEYSNSSLRFGR